MFRAARQLLFQLPPERAHDVTLGALDWADRLQLTRWMGTPVDDSRKLMGLRFSNAVGLSAGLDKNADHVPGLAALGFGFLELGTVTPRAQPGNPGPRLFRLPEHNALINRLGFNNKGVDHLCAQMYRLAPRPNIPLGINIGKNRDTPMEQALDDYCHCLRAVYASADYVAVNLSSPNTPGLRSLQAGAELSALVQALKAEQAKLAEQSQRYVPLVIKIAPDLDRDPLFELIDTLMDCGIDGVCATNTTISREAVAGARYAEESGGLSGEPVRAKATAIVEQIRQHAGPDLPIIAVGGIMSAADAVEKMQAGANLVQLYTGLIYNGPQLIHQAAKAIQTKYPAQNTLS